MCVCLSEKMVNESLCVCAKERKKRKRERERERDRENKKMYSAFIHFSFLVRKSNLFKPIILTILDDLNKEMFFAGQVYMRKSL